MLWAGWPQHWQQAPIAQTGTGPWSNYGGPPESDLVPKPAGLFDDLLPKAPVDSASNPFAAELDRRHETAVRKHVVEMAIFAAGVPAFLLLLGSSLMWVGRGFRRDAA